MGAINSEHLKYFELAYTEGSFAAAARRIPVSPQGLTKGIRSLEKELGVDLFTLDPDTGRPVPTPYAHEVFDFASVFQSNLRLLNEALDRIRGRERHTVRLGCSAGVLGAFGPECLNDFCKLHPNVDVPFSESHDRQCEKDLLDGTYDIAIVVKNEVTPGCTGVKLYESPVYLWMRRDDPLAAEADEDGMLHVESLEGRSIAIPGRGYTCFENLNALAERSGVHLASIVEIHEIFRLYNYVARTDGMLGFSNGTLVDVPVFNQGNQIIALPLAELTWRFFLERESHHALDDAEQALWNWFLRKAGNLPHNSLRDPTVGNPETRLPAQRNRSDRQGARDHADERH